jgi:hypothetical protein
MLFTAGLGVSLSCLALSAAAALGDGTAPDYPGSVLHVAVTGPKVADHPVTIVATGSNQMTSLGTPIDYGLVIFLVNPKVLNVPCATSESAEETIAADNTGGARQLNFEDISEGESGSFSLSVPFTPGGSGSLLVCAYSEYVTDDAAWASTETTITGGQPAIVAKPRLTRHGRRVSCAHGSWSGDPTTFSYHWKLDARPSADTRSWLQLPAHGHLTVLCTVTAGNTSGRASASTRTLSLG